MSDLTQAEREIGQALMSLRKALTKHEIAVPDVLTYEDRDRGHRGMTTLQHVLQRRIYSTKPAHERHVEMCGFTFKATPHE